LFLTLKDYKFYEKVIIKSHGKLILGNDIHDDNQNDNEHSVLTLAYSNINIQTEKKLPLWIYVASVMIGILLLLLCTFAFWMVMEFFYLSFALDNIRNFKLLKSYE
jgi:hypothetical protein